MSDLADTPNPPYSVAIFTSLRTEADDEGYAAAADEMMALAAEQPGYLGVETVRDSSTGFGITISYWTDEAAIAAWRNHAEHRIVRRLGREQWYRAFRVRVGRIERQRAFARSGHSSNIRSTEAS